VSFSHLVLQPIHQNDQRMNIADFQLQFPNFVAQVALASGSIKRVSSAWTTACTTVSVQPAEVNK
jgi:hypothetical protein